MAFEWKRGNEMPASSGLNVSKGCLVGVLWDSRYTLLFASQQECVKLNMILVCLLIVTIPMFLIGIHLTSV